VVSDYMHSGSFNLRNAAEPPKPTDRSVRTVLNELTDRQVDFCYSHTVSANTQATSPSDTRRRILDVATELFRDRGYAGTSIRDIADGLGMTKAALYYHFTCKDDMLDALVAPTVGAVEAFVEAAEASPDTDPAVLIRDFVEILACNVPTLATALGDPVVLRSEAGRFRLMEKQVRLARLIAGPGADEARLLRARAAIGAVKASMEATAGLCMETGDPLAAQKAVRRNLDTIVAAAVGALEGCPSHNQAEQGKRSDDELAPCERAIVEQVLAGQIMAEPAIPEQSVPYSY
jgi:AcrR family transcriptional regulator